jgi:hypothetical protein
VFAIAIAALDGVGLVTLSPKMAHAVDGPTLPDGLALADGVSFEAAEDHRAHADSFTVRVGADVAGRVSVGVVLPQQVGPGRVGLIGDGMEELPVVLLFLLGVHHIDSVSLDLVETKQGTCPPVLLLPTRPTLPRLVLLHVLFIVPATGRRTQLAVAVRGRRVDDQRLFDGQVLQVGGEVFFELHS